MAEKTNAQFLVYPNPTSGNFMIQFSNEANYTVSIIDVIGKEVFRVSSNGSLLKQVDLSGFESGIYYINVNDGDSQITKNLVLTK